MKIIDHPQIQRILPGLDLMPEIERGFMAYSQGRAVVPPIGELILDKGEVHIKYGCIRDEAYYVVKIASGFYGNPEMGLSSGNGMMLLFSQHTGEPVSILLDQGSLTDTRTAVAGAIAAKYLAPVPTEMIGIVGTGTQARMQLRYLKGVVQCRKVLAWGPTRQGLERFRIEMEQEGFSVATTLESDQILKHCNLVVTATPSRNPILKGKDLLKGTHITAVGSDTPEKQELDPLILQRAGLLVTDSLSQSLDRGEIFQARKEGHLEQREVVELGQIIAGERKGRVSGDQVSVADLTGVAVQDIAIATAVYRAACG